MDKYPGKDNYGRPKRDYINKISNFNDDDLLAETESKIWLSAYAANNPRSDFHWHASACYDEWVRRNKVGKYKLAFSNASKTIG